MENRLRYRYLLLVLMCMLSACRQDMDKPSNEKEDEIWKDIEAKDGFIRVKFTNEWGDKINGITRSATTKTNNYILDSVANVYGVETMKRTFPPTKKFEKRTREAGLHLWYDIKFDPQHVITRVALDLKTVPGIEIVEAIPKVRIVPTGQFKEFYIGSNNDNESKLPFNDPLLHKQWNYRNDGSVDKMLQGADINLFPAWEQSTGNGEIIVAIVDGGIDYLHEDLAQNMWINTTELNGTPGEDSDENGYIDDIFGSNFIKDSISIHAHGHGTHVAGLVGAVNNNEVGICGVAGGNGTVGSGVKLMSCQIFDYDENGKEISSDRIPAAIKYAADNGAIICQNSWGYENIASIPQSLVEAFDYFIENAGVDNNNIQTGPMRGGIIFFAAGNNNRDIFSPAFSPKVIAVASMASDYKRAPYSCYGDWVDITAPGGDKGYGVDHMILSTYPNNKYAYLEGTSMACPHVSGVAALLVAKYGGEGFTPDKLREYLFRGVGSIEAYNHGYVGKLGVGYLNAAGALFNKNGNIPDSISDLNGDVSHKGIELQWSAVADREDISPRTYKVDYALKSINIQEEVNHEIIITLEKPSVVGAKLTYLVTDVLPDTIYNFQIHAIDAANNISLPSSRVEFTTKTINKPPYIIQPLKDHVFSSIGETLVLNLDEYFADDDGMVSFNIQINNSQTYTWRLNKSLLSITIIEPEVATIVVTATDDAGVECKGTFKLSFESNVVGPIIYPNPVQEYINVLMPPHEKGQMLIEIYSLYGIRIYRQTITVEPHIPIKLDAHFMQSGMYTMKCILNGKNYQFSLVKE